jgi:hypothetical protein
MQAECQCRATSGNFFNCIVFSKLRGTGQLGQAAIRGAPVARFHQGGGFRPGVGDHNLANQNLAIKNPAIKHFAIHSASLSSMPILERR